MESTKKFIENLSNEIIKDKISEWLSIEDIIAFFKEQEPKNSIEKRVIQRSICILWGFLLMKNGKFKNIRLTDLLSYLQIK
jgi:hypothetical protein